MDIMEKAEEVTILNKAHYRIEKQIDSVLKNDTITLTLHDDGFRSRLADLLQDELEFIKHELEKRLK